MRKLKKFMMIDCYAFTATALVNGIIAATNKEQAAVSLSYVLPIFAVSSIVALLIVVTDRFCEQNQFLHQLIHIMDIMIPVLLYGMITTDSGLQVQQIAENILVCLFLYGIVSLMMVMSWREKDHKANESLQKMREKRQKRQ